MSTYSHSLSNQPQVTVERAAVPLETANVSAI